MHDTEMNISLLSNIVYVLVSMWFILNVFVYYASLLVAEN